VLCYEVLLFAGRLATENPTGFLRRWVARAIAALDASLVRLISRFRRKCLAYVVAKH
jgi:hypothetical protein